ncbi:hypothetical protein Tco_1576518 [Tanacetum coccineum]
MSGDGRGNGGDALGSGGVGAAACSTMRAFMDADIAEGIGSTTDIAEESTRARKALLLLLKYHPRPPKGAPHPHH